MRRRILASSVALLVLISSAVFLTNSSTRLQGSLTCTTPQFLKIDNPSYGGVIAVGPDNQIWTVKGYDQNPYKIGKTNTNSHAYSSIDLTGLLQGGVRDMAAGPDGNMWVTRINQIDKISPAGVTLGQYPIPQSTGITTFTENIIAGPDGNMWFGAWDAIWKITMNGTPTKFSLPYPRVNNQAQVNITEIISASDSNIWFLDYITQGSNYIPKLVKLRPSDAQMTEYDVPGARGGMNSMVQTNGYIFYTKTDRTIGRLKLDGTAAASISLTGLTEGDELKGITADANNNLWVIVEYSGSPKNLVLTKLSGSSLFAASNPSATSSSYIFPSNDFNPPDGSAITVGPDGNIWAADSSSSTIWKFGCDGIPTPPAPSPTCTQIINFDVLPDGTSVNGTTVTGHGFNGTLITNQYAAANGATFSSNTQPTIATAGGGNAATTQPNFLVGYNPVAPYSNDSYKPITLQISKPQGGATAIADSVEWNFVLVGGEGAKATAYNANNAEVWQALAAPKTNGFTRMKIPANGGGIAKVVFETTNPSASNPAFGIDDMKITFAGPCSGSQSSASQNPIAHYTFDDGTAKDSSGNNFNGTLYGATPQNGCMKFGGQDSIDIGKIGQKMPQDALTFTAWVKKEDGVLEPGAFFNSEAAGWGIGFWKKIGAGKLWAMGGSGLTSTADLKANTFTHIAVTYNGSEIKLYLNGVLDSSKTTTAYGVPNNPSDFTIGGRGQWGEFPGSGFFKGTMDDVQIYNRVLSESEITAISQQPASCNSGVLAGPVADPGLICGTQDPRIICLKTFLGATVTPKFSLNADGSYVVAFNQLISPDTIKTASAKCAIDLVHPGNFTDASIQSVLSPPVTLASGGTHTGIFLGSCNTATLNEYRANNISVQPAPEATDCNQSYLRYTYLYEGTNLYKGIADTGAGGVFPAAVCNPRTPDVSSCTAQDERVKCVNNYLEKLYGEATTPNALVSQADGSVIGYWKRTKDTQTISYLSLQAIAAQCGVSTPNPTNFTDASLLQAKTQANTTGMTGVGIDGPCSASLVNTYRTNGHKISVDSNCDTQSELVFEMGNSDATVDGVRDTASKQVGDKALICVPTTQASTSSAAPLVNNCSDGVDNDGDGKIDKGLTAQPQVITYNSADEIRAAINALGSAKVPVAINSMEFACDQGMYFKGPIAGGFCEFLGATLTSHTCAYSACGAGGTPTVSGSAYVSGNQILRESCDAWYVHAYTTWHEYLKTIQCTIGTQCSDGIDNDSDGKKDFPQDTGCASANDTSEIPSDPDCDTSTNEGVAQSSSAACIKPEFVPSGTNSIDSQLLAQGWTELSPGLNQTVTGPTTQGGVTYFTMNDNSTARGMRTEFTAIKDAMIADKNWTMEMKAKILSSDPGAYVLGMNMMLASPAGRQVSIMIDTNKIGVMGPSVGSYNYSREVNKVTTDAFHTYKIDYHKNASGVNDDTYDVLFDNVVIIANVKRNELFDAGAVGQIINGISFGIGSSPGRGAMQIAYVKFNGEGYKCSITNPTGAVCSGTATLPANSTQVRVSFEGTSTGTTISDQYLESKGVNVNMPNGISNTVKKVNKKIFGFKNIDLEKIVEITGSKPEATFEFINTQSQPATTDAKTFRILLFGTGSATPQIKATAYDIDGVEIEALTFDAGPQYIGFTKTKEMAKMKIELLTAGALSFADISYAPLICSGMSRTAQSSSSTTSAAIATSTSKSSSSLLTSTSRPASTSTSRPSTSAAVTSSSLAAATSKAVTTSSSSLTVTSASIQATSAQSSTAATVEAASSQSSVWSGVLSQQENMQGYTCTGAVCAAGGQSVCASYGFACIEQGQWPCYACLEQSALDDIQDGVVDGQISLFIPPTKSNASIPSLVLGQQFSSRQSQSSAVITQSKSSAGALSSVGLLPIQTQTLIPLADATHTGAPVPQTGPASAVAVAAGAASGVAWVRRKKKR